MQGYHSHNQIMNFIDKSIQGFHFTNNAREPQIMRLSQNKLIKEKCLHYGWGMVKKTLPLSYRTLTNRVERERQHQKRSLS